MLSNSLAYAIKALIYIAQNSSETERITLKEISDSTLVPRPYIAKILQALVRSNVLQSVKGPNGGFYFREEGLEINLLQIAHILEGPDKYSNCILSLKECSAESPCPLHSNVGQIRTMFLESLEQITFRRLLQHEKSFDLF